jgi:hypothetical protein
MIRISPRTRLVGAAISFADSFPIDLSHLRGTASTPLRCPARFRGQSTALARNAFTNSLMSSGYS